MTISILKIILVLVILAVMIIVLISINHVFAGSFSCDNEDIDELRRDLVDHDEIITNHSSFSDFVRVKQPVDSPKKYEGK